MSVEVLRIGTVEKKADEQIRISIKRLNSYDYLDIRTWWRKEETDEWLPTKKGITLRPDVVPEVAELISRAAAEILAHRGAA